MGFTRKPLSLFLHSFNHIFLFSEKRRHSVLELSDCAFCSDSLKGYTRKANEHCLPLCTRSDSEWAAGWRRGLLKADIEVTGRAAVP